MTRAFDETQAEALQVIENIVQRAQFQLAAVAASGIDVANRQAASQADLRRRFEPSASDAVVS